MRTYHKTKFKISGCANILEKIPILENRWSFPLQEIFHGFFKYRSNEMNRSKLRKPCVWRYKWGNFSCLVGNVQPFSKVIGRFRLQASTTYDLFDGLKSFHLDCLLKQGHSASLLKRSYVINGDKIFPQRYLSHTCLEKEVQGYGMTFKVCNLAQSNTISIVVMY